MVKACPSPAAPGRSLRVKAVLGLLRAGSRSGNPSGIKVHPDQQHLCWSGLGPGQELLPRHPACSPQTPSSCCPQGPAPHGRCCLKEMSGAPEKVLRNLSPRISWLWGVIKACLPGLFLALKTLVVLPGPARFISAACL